MRNLWTVLIVPFLGIFLAPLATAQSLPLEPPHAAGKSITGAFEGWFKNADGTYSLLLGYYNRNQQQEVDIPIGPNNRIELNGTEPGTPDQGQPTHFVPGRNWGVFVVKVPADFGNKKLIWTIVANGQPTSIPAYLHGDYEISPFSEASAGNTPPTIGFEENGPRAQGPVGMTAERTVKVDTPLRLMVWTEDDAKWVSNSGARPRVMPPAVVLSFNKYRGPGEVTFSKQRPEIESIVRKDSKASAYNGSATTTAIFSQPGEYILHIGATDYSGPGGAGFQCCWSNAQVKVTVQK